MLDFLVTMVLLGTCCCIVMLKQFLKSWKNNNGIQLLAVGATVGLAFCLLWYGQWLPEIQFGVPKVASRPPTAATPKNYFVARIVGPARTDTKSTSGAVMLFTSVADSPNDQRLPIAMAPFELDSQGTATVVLPLDPGRFAAIAFLDTNQNSQMDVDSDGNPLEPFRSSSTASQDHDWRDLQSAEFDVEPASTQFRLMQFNE